LSEDGPGVPDRQEYLRRWSVLHGGYDPRRSRAVTGWLSLTYLLARPVAAAGVSPDLVTLAGLLVTGAAADLAWVGGGWALVGGLVVVVSGLLDNVDGAVAVMTGRDSRFGSVLDSVADRVGDGLYVLALWLVGAPAGLAVLAGSLTLLQEYARARAGAVGMSEIGVVTVAERPTRVIVTAGTLAVAGLLPDRAAHAGLVGALVWTALGAVGLVQLLVVARRRLS